MKSFNEFREVQLEEGSENLPGKATHILNKDVRHPDHGIVQNGTVLRKTGEGKYEIRAGRAKGRIVGLDAAHVNKLDEGYVPAERNRPEMSASDKSKMGKVADLMAKEKSKKDDLPFTPDKPHKPVAKAGKYGSGYSTARHLARQGMKDVQKEEVEIEEEITPVQSAAARQKLKDIEKSGVKKSQDLYNKLTRIANAHPIKEETEMSQMEQYLAAISGNADFRSALEEKKLTPAELKKREEIAQAMERENPGMDTSKKMAIATAQAKKVAEEVEIEEGKEHTVPKTEKEKDLAALAEPKDKITHADVMKGRGVAKEEVELDETPVTKAKAPYRPGSIDPATGKTRKAPEGTYAADKAKRMQKLNKEGVEMKTFSQLMAEINEAKGDYGWDYPEKDEKPASTTRKVAGTRYGGSAQKDEPEDDEDDKPAEKRGRGRPAGSKSGARH